MSRLVQKREMRRRRENSVTDDIFRIIILSKTGHREPMNGPVVNDDKK